MEEAEEAALRKEWDRAIALFEKAKAEDPEETLFIDSRVRNVKHRAGMEHFQLGQNASSVHDFSRAIFQFRMALRYNQSPEYREALDKAKRAKIEHEYAGCYEKGVRALAERRLTEAKRRFQGALRIMPDRSEPGEQLERIATLEEQAREQYAAGQKHQSAGRWGDAVKCFDAALSNWATYSEAKAARDTCRRRIAYETAFTQGETARAAGDLEGALASYSRASNHLSTSDVRSRISAVRGALYDRCLQQGDSHRATSDWNAAIQSYEMAKGFRSTEEIAKRIAEASYSRDFGLARRREANGELEAALDAYERAQSHRGTEEVGAAIHRIKRRIREIIAKFVRVEADFPFLHKGYFITACAHLCGESLGGNRSHLVSFRINNQSPVRCERMIAQISLQGFSDAASKTFSVGARSSKTIELTPSFTAALSNLREQRPGAIRVSVQGPDGQVLLEETKRITLLSRNEMLLSESAAGLIPVFVTPNDPLVEQLITHAAERTSRRAMAGYQGGAGDVLEEIGAIYETVAELDVHYRSSLVSFLDTPTLKAQRTYYPAESIAGTGANCLDGSILFASAFENIGLDTAIVLVPGHAFVGARLRRGDNASWCFVESTQVGNASFADAAQAGEECFRRHQAGRGAKLIEIKPLRRIGVKPFPYPISVGQFSISRKLHRRGIRQFELTLQSLSLAPADYVQGRYDPGGAPELFVKVFVNDNCVLDTSRVFAQDSWGVSWRGMGVRARFKFSRTDKLRIDIRDRDALGSNYVFGFEFAWSDLTGRRLDIRTRAGTTLDVDLREVK